MTIWAAISWYSSGLVSTLSGQITASDYVDNLGNQMHPMIQRFFLTMQFFIMTVRPYTQPEVFSLGLTSTEMHLTSSLAGTITKLKYDRTSVVGFREYGEQQIPFPHYLSSN